MGESEAAMAFDAVQVHGALRRPALPRRVPERDRTSIPRRLGQGQEDARAAVVPAAVRAVVDVPLPRREADRLDDGVDPPGEDRGQHATHLRHRALHRRQGRRTRPRPPAEQQTPDDGEPLPRRSA